MERSCWLFACCQGIAWGCIHPRQRKSRRRTGSRSLFQHYSPRRPHTRVRTGKTSCCCTQNCWCWQNSTWPTSRRHILPHFQIDYCCSFDTCSLHASARATSSPQVGGAQVVARRYLVALLQRVIGPHTHLRIDCHNIVLA
jgi:hypothetical protein